MSHHSPEFKELLSSTSDFLLHLWKEGSHCPFSLSLSSTSQPLPLRAEEKKNPPVEPPLKEILLPSLKETPPLPVETSSSLPEKVNVTEDPEVSESTFQPVFSLQLENPPEEQSLDSMQQLCQKLFPTLPQLPLPLPILLVGFSSDSSERDFLQKVAHTLSKALAPATVLQLKPGETPPPSLLLLAPLSPKHSDKFNIHTLTQWRGTYFLPLAPLTSYIQDPQLKRDLWNALKTLPFPSMLRSFSTSPSVNLSTMESPSLSSTKQKKVHKSASS